MKKILLINGSHRNGNTDILVKEIKKFQNVKIYFDELKLRNLKMKLPDGCENCAKAEICPNIIDKFSKNIEPKIKNYDVYIICTPTWDDGVTPLVKIFWDRIVSWSHDDRKYLKNKKLGIITHGMAGKNSWIHPINWIKSVCFWEKSIFLGSVTFFSGSKVGSLEIEVGKLKKFINKI